jgi:hypothetical protein
MVVEVADVVVLMTIIATLVRLKRERDRVGVRQRQMWTRPWLQRRHMNLSSMHLLHDELAIEDPDSYRNYIRMDETLFQASYLGCGFRIAIWYGT